MLALASIPPVETPMSAIRKVGTTTNPPPGLNFSPTGRPWENYTQTPLSTQGGTLVRFVRYRSRRRAIFRRLRAIFRRVGGTLSNSISFSLLPCPTFHAFARRSHGLRIRHFSLRITAVIQPRTIEFMLPKRSACARGFGNPVSLSLSLSKPSSRVASALVSPRRPFAKRDVRLLNKRSSSRSC